MYPVKENSKYKVNTKLSKNLLLKSEKQCILTMGNNIYAKILPNNLHHSEVVSGNRQHNYAILVIVCSLNFRKFILNPAKSINACLR